MEPFRATPLRPADPAEREPDAGRCGRRLDGEFCRAVDLFFRCRGSVIVSGMGKAGLIGQKIMATLASTGTRSHCLHPAEAVHGDLGRVHRDDVMLILSQSGETEEVAAAAALAGRVGRADRGHHRPGGKHAGPGGHGGASSSGRWKRPRRWVWPPAPAPRPCWPSAMPWRWSSARCGNFRPRGFRPLPSGRQPGPQAEQGGASHAAAGTMPRGRRREQTIREVLRRR